MEKLKAKKSSFVSPTHSSHYPVSCIVGMPRWKHQQSQRATTPITSPIIVIEAFWSFVLISLLEPPSLNTKDPRSVTVFTSSNPRPLMLTPVGPYSLRDFTSVLLSSMLSFIPYNLEIENVSVIMSDQIITQRRVSGFYYTRKISYARRYNRKSLYFTRICRIVHKH